MRTFFITIILLYAFVYSIAQSLPNNGFENWDTTGIYPVLNDWTTSNETYAYVEGGGIVVERTNDSHSGAFAARIGTAYMGFVGAATPCFIVNGDFEYANSFPFPPDYMTAGTPINQKISVLHGYYKYQTNMATSGSAHVFLKRYNTDTGMTEMVGYGTTQLPPQANYTAFQVPVEDLIPGVIPDSIVVAFQSFDFSGISNTNLSATLFVDAISLIGTTDVENVATPLARIYPNPTSENLWIESVDMKYVEVRLFSISGREIRRMYYENFPLKYSLEMSDLEKGAYILEIKRGDELVFVEKVLVK